MAMTDRAMTERCSELYNERVVPMFVVMSCATQLVGLCNRNEDPPLSPVSRRAPCVPACLPCQLVR